MQHVLRCWIRQSDGSEYKKTLRQPGLRPGPRCGSLQRSRKPPSWWGWAGCRLPKNPIPRSRPFGPRLSYPHSKISSDAVVHPERPAAQPGQVGASSRRHSELVCVVDSSASSVFITGVDLPVAEKMKVTTGCRPRSAPDVSQICLGGFSIVRRPFVTSDTTELTRR